MHTCIITVLQIQKRLTTAFPVSRSSQLLGLKRTDVKSPLYCLYIRILKFWLAYAETMLVNVVNSVLPNFEMIWKKFCRAHWGNSGKSDVEILYNIGLEQLSVEENFRYMITHKNPLRPYRCGIRFDVLHFGKWANEYQIFNWIPAHHHRTV